MPRLPRSVNRPPAHAASARAERPPGLLPISDVEMLRPTSFRATSATPWLLVDLGGPVSDGCWVAMRYRAGLLQDPVRPLLRLVDAAGSGPIDIMPGPVCGAAIWVGRIPPGTVRIEISPVASVGPFAFSLDEVRRLGRWRLVAGAIRRKPGLALEAVWLRLAGKRVRARHFVKSIWASTPMTDYPRWRRARLPRPALPEPAPPSLPLTVVVDAAGAAPGDVATTRASLGRQGEGITIVEVGAPDAPRPVSQPGWMAVMRAGDTLQPGAVAAFAALAARDPALTLIYCDEDEIDRAGRSVASRLKPDWSPRLQDGIGYIGDLAMARVDAVGPVPASASDLVATALARPAAKVGHVRRILYHRRISRPAMKRAPRPRGIAERAAAKPRPPVSIVVPTRDRLDLLRLCVEGLRTRTDYPDVEIVIVDNGSVEAATHAYYASLAGDPRLRVLPRPGPFNFSALCNGAVAVAAGDIVVLLNNDIEVAAADWLDRLVAEAVRPEVGAVGARLLYPDRRLQHGGVVVGLGGAAGHIHRGRPGAKAGWLGRLAVSHEVSAVTGACLAVARDKYLAVGGLDEEAFPVSFNDIDFCLKLRREGWTNMMVPDAVMTHHESASRGRDVAGAKQARAEREAASFAERWLPVMRDDPCFHPGLSLLRFDVSLG